MISDWDCIRDGDRFLIAWNPKYKKEVLLEIEKLTRGLYKLYKVQEKELEVK